MKILLGSFFLLLSLTGFTQSREIPYTQDDRDRMIRLEEKVESLDVKMELVEKNLNIRMDGLEDKFELLREDMNSKFNLLSTLVISLIVVMFGFTGYLVWDRKTTLKPVRKSQDELIELLRQYAKEKDDKVLKKLLDKAAMF